jgi:hypothetical protein
VVERTSTKKKKKRTQKRHRRERRFAPQQTYTSILSAVGGMLGAIALGAGVYAEWISDPAHKFAPFVVTGGAVVLGAALWFGDRGALPVRVGDAGIAIEKGTDVLRLAWCDVKRLYVERGQLVAKGDRLTFSIPIGAQPVAVSWILAEAARRVPDVVDVKGSVADDLPEPKEGDGEPLVIDSLQLAGHHCASSGEVIAFERDARLCPTCGQVYHKAHVPKKCVTCGATVGESAISV